MTGTYPKTLDFTQTELWTIQSTVNERYGRPVPVEVAETEVRLNPEDRVLVTRPSAYWDDGQGCHFVVIKLAPGTYRCQFYYRGYEQFGTGRDRYDDLLQAVIALLQVQSDYERIRRQRQEQQVETVEKTNPGPTEGNGDDDSYKYSPLYWGD